MFRNLFSIGCLVVFGCCIQAGELSVVCADLGGLAIADQDGQRLRAIVTLPNGVVRTLTLLPGQRTPVVDSGVTLTRTGFDLARPANATVSLKFEFDDVALRLFTNADGKPLRAVRIQLELSGRNNPGEIRDLIATASSYLTLAFPEKAECDQTLTHCTVENGLSYKSRCRLFHRLK